MLVVFVALLLIVLVLVQQTKGGGFGSAFGGGESVFGAHAASHMTKMTVILASAFFVLALLLAVLTGHRRKSESIAETGSGTELVPAGIEEAAITEEEPQKPEAGGMEVPAVDGAEALSEPVPAEKIEVKTEETGKTEASP